MKERIENCMETRCVDATKNAQKVIENENKRRQAQKTKFILDPTEYLNLKYSSVESVSAVMEAEDCLKKCQHGRDVIAKTLEQNLQEFYTNIQLCYKSHESHQEGGRHQVNYQGVIGCLESNISILNNMEKRLNDELLSR